MQPTSKPLTFEEAHGVLWEHWHPFVPARCYAGESIGASQILIDFWRERFAHMPEDEQPVVLRGSRHCMRYRHGGPRYFFTALALRYIRRMRVTETDPARWHEWLDERLLPRLAKREDWYRQRSTMDDLQSLVSAWSVVIDGRRQFVSDEQRRLVERLHATVRRLDAPTTMKRRRRKGVTA